MPDVTLTVDGNKITAPAGTLLIEACKGAGSPIRLFYLDSCGFAASLMNRMLLKQKLPNLSQIQFWDTYLVAASLVVDPLLGFNFGKTVVGVWRKPD